MSPAAGSARRKSEPAKTSPSPGATTREVLIELAAQVFATEGYASASVRDLSRRAGVTSGAIYGNFRDKAGLLAEAVDARLTTDLWTLPDDITSRSLVAIVAYQFENLERREQLMSLLLEGAVAAPHDAHLRGQLQEALGRRIDASSQAFEARRDAEGFDPATDLDAAVKMFYAIEIGLRALSALGIDAPDATAVADVVRLYTRALQANATTASPAPAAGRAKRPAKKSAPSVSKTAKSSKKAAAKTVPRKRVA